MPSDLALTRSTRILGLSVVQPVTYIDSINHQVDVSDAGVVYRTLGTVQQFGIRCRVKESDRAELVAFKRSYRNILYGASGEFVFEWPQEIREPTGSVDALVDGDTAAGTSVVDLSNAVHVVPVGRYVQFEGHSKLYLVDASTNTRLTLVPNLVQDVADGARLKYEGGEVMFQGYETTGGPFEWVYDDRGIVEHQFEFVERLL